MIRRTIAFFISMILCWISSSVRAAEISCPYGKSACLVPSLNGQIYKGDYDKVAAFLRARHPTVGDFFLNSPGGDVDEALKIGRLFRKYSITTTTSSRRDDGSFSSPDPWCRNQNCICASACALIWLGGVYRDGTVGLHRPRTNDPMFKGLSPADASTMYRRVLERVETYLNEMEVPKSIIESMITTSSSDVRWVDSSDEGLDQPPSIAEWVDASCGRS